MAPKNANEGKAVTEGKAAAGNKGGARKATPRTGKGSKNK